MSGQDGRRAGRARKRAAFGSGRQRADAYPNMSQMAMMLLLAVAERPIHAETDPLMPDQEKYQDP